MTSKNIIILDIETDMRLAFLAALMHVSKGEYISFLVDSMFDKTLQNLSDLNFKNNN